MSCFLLDPFAHTEMCNEIINLFVGDTASRGSRLFRLISLPFHQADTLLERGNESSPGAPVSQRVINYPDSFCVARALLSIKVALGRGNFLRGAACYSGDRDIKPWAILFATLGCLRKGIKQDEGAIIRTRIML